MTVVVDSNIVIDVLRRREETVGLRWLSTVESGIELAYSAVTLTEVWHGAATRDYRAIETIFDSVRCLIVDDRIAKQAGQYLRRYRPSHGVDFADALIAATAAIHDYPLWTRNRKHFPMPELTLF